MTALDSRLRRIERRCIDSDPLAHLSDEELEAMIAAIDTTLRQVHGLDDEGIDELTRRHARNATMSDAELGEIVREIKMESPSNVIGPA